MLSMTMAVLLPALAATPQELDGFAYPDAATAARAWVAAEGAPPVRVVEVGGGRKAVELTAPFAADTKVKRAVVDRRVDLDLAEPGQFRLEVETDQPEVFGAVTLYFRSGAGWYGGQASLDRKGRQTLRYEKSTFRTEGSPAGWHRIDGIRLAFWKGAERDAAVRLLRLEAVRHDVAIVVPAADGAARGEARFALETAARLQDWITELGLGADVVEEGAVARGGLASRRLAILPLNPGIDGPAVEALARFAKEGGKLFVCYSLPRGLEEVLGIGRTRFVKPEAPGVLAEIRFGEPRPAGMPAAVKQASWNILAAEPRRGEARVLARWYDDKGRDTGLPALLVSPAGAFFSHVVLDDDPEAKRQMLGAVLASLVPDLGKDMATGALERAVAVGPFEDLEALGRHVAATGSAAARAKLAAARERLARAQQLLAAGEAMPAVAAADAGRALAAEAYLRAAPAVAAEGRGFWEHSGLGAYPGDWERTARELAAAGFNQVVPNMLWGGVAHYPSDLLPRSPEFAKYGDQIAACVEAAHRHGLEVHVWKVNHNLLRAPRSFVETLRKEGRTQVSVDGEPLDWLCPSHPSNFALERDSMLEVARKYEVDGLHFDYIRYPDDRHCYCGGCRQRFEAERGAAVKNWPADCARGALASEYRDWRCKQITRLVEAVSREARAIRPGLKISAAVFSAYPDCRETVGQDWVAWVQAGLLDFVCPMDYTGSDLAFATMVANQERLVAGRIPIYPGIGASSSRSRLSADRVVSQILAARASGAEGFTIFNLDADTIGTIAPGVGLGIGSRPAVAPHRR